LLLLPDHLAGDGDAQRAQHRGVILLGHARLQARCPARGAPAASTTGGALCAGCAPAGNGRPVSPASRGGGRRARLVGLDAARPGQPGHYFGEAAAALRHEPGYEHWFVTRFLPAIRPELLE
jgi:hypothetical protein